MKLPDGLAHFKPEDAESVEQLMLYWVGQGWSVFPLAPRSKEPYAGTNGVKDATNDPAQIAAWAKKWPDANIGGSCAGKLVIDVDPRNGGKMPDGLPPTRQHFSGRGDGGVHLIYSLTDLQRIKSGSNVLGEGVDVKTGANSYVVLPGSIHPDTGRKYTADDQPVVFVSEDLLKRIRTAQASGGEGGGEVRSMLSSLLRNPPAEGGRNEWLAKICGHYAKKFRSQPDLYWTQVWAANQLLSIKGRPLDEAEVDKTAKSIWNTETSGHPERDFLETLREEAGWLVSGDYQLMTAGYEGDDKKTDPVPVQFADFDLKLVGILTDPDDGSQVYEMLLQRARDHSEVPVNFKASVFGDPKNLRSKLAGYGVVVTQPDKLVHKSPDWASKLHQYVRSQTAPEYIRVDHIGWCDDEKGFLTFDGVIDKNGPRGCTVARPNPDLKTSRAATQRYGTEATAAEAREILGEVVQFQELDTVTQFGAWWAANFAKHRIRRYTNMFPVMAIEAASGSGKTSGFFSLMVQLSGSTTGEGHYTIPTLRNALAANYNGVVWVDDLDDPQNLHELIRVLTQGGTLTKMVNHTMSVNYDLVGSMILSGESLELNGQKATMDRCVVLSPNSPTERKSAKGEYLQWNDIVEVSDRLNELNGGASLAGHFVTAVLAADNEISRACGELRTKSPSGREGARWFTLAVGARILDYLLTGDRSLIESGEGQYFKRFIELSEKGDPVDESGETRMTIKSDNTLTQRVLPMFLSTQGINSESKSHIARMYEENDEYEVMVNIRSLAEWWREKHNGRIQTRTESENGLEQQLIALKNAYPNSVTRGIRARTGSASQVRRFARIDGALAREIVLRSQD